MTPGRLRSGRPSRRPGEAFRPSWQTFLPLGVVVLSLLAVAVLPVARARRTDRMRDEVTVRVIPARHALSGFTVAVSSAVSAMRAWLLTNDQAFADEFRRSAAEADRTLAEVRRRLDESHLAPAAAELAHVFQTWEQPAQAMMSGRAPRASYLASLPSQARRAQAALELSARLEQRLAGWLAAAGEEMRAESGYQRLLTVALVVIALAGAVGVGGLAVQSRRLARLLRYRAQEERALRDVARALSSAVTVAEVAQRVVTAAVDTTRGFGAYVERARQGEVEVVALAGDGVPALGTHAPFPGSLTEAIVGSGEATAVAEVGTIGQPMASYLAERCEGCTALVVPLLGGGDVLGALVVLRSSDQDPFGPDEVRHAQALGDLVSAALRRVILLEQTDLERKEKTALLESTAQGLWGVDEHGRASFVNSAAARTLGYTAEEMLGHPVHPLVHHTRPDGTPYPEAECPMTRVMATRERIMVAGEMLWRRDGTSFLADYSAAPIIIADEVRGAVVAFSDATERHRREREIAESEAQFRALAENASAAIFVMQQDDTIVFANPGTQIVFGYRPDELLGKPLTDLMPPDLRESHRAGVRRFLASGQRHIRWEGVELVGLRKDGATIPLEVTIGSFVRDDVPYFVGTAQDITARKEAERERLALLDREREARERAEAAVRTRDEILAIVSHDLRNPLNTVSLAVGAVESGDVPPEAVPAHLQIMRRAVERMNRLIADLLDVARLEAGHELSVQHERLDLGPVVAEACASFQAEAERKLIQIECRLGEGLPAVGADRDRLMQVLANLVGNALKFTEEGGRVEVEVRPDGGMVEVSVKDTGPGIPPDDLAHIFNPYWQARKTARLGAGLGLAIARGIVEAHGGRIWAESTPGAGSTFRFTLPAAKEHWPEVDAPTTTTVS
ncbi:MAG TPA: PAS domain S-box protein [Vicinamibacteria bacterium]|nr:PAS domain S-box protein [Vicinamibacteria bacterium]